MTAAQVHVRQLVDLRTTVPAGWSLAGLSSAHFDGANPFRTPTAPVSTIRFPASEVLFAQLRYQLYSAATSVTGIVRLDGHEVGRHTFLAGQFTDPVQLGAFVHPGVHTLGVEYRCGDQPCPTTVRQYWTQMMLVSPGRPAREDAGIGVERWFLDAPDSLLHITGASPLFFDGQNYARNVVGQQLTISWPAAQVLNTTMQLYAPEPIRVTLTVNGKVLDVQQGDRAHLAVPAASMVGRREVQTVAVRVECLASTARQGCATLYNPQIAVSIQPPVTFLQLLETAGATMVLCWALWKLLRLPRLVRARGN